MANQLNLSTASQLFDTEVTLKFQNHQFLQNTIEERHGCTGDATNVPVSDLIEMQLQSFAPVDIVASPVNPTNVIIVPYNYALKTVIGGGEKTLFAYDKIVDHSKLHAKACARMLDYIKINALYTYSGFNSLFTVSDIGANHGVNEAKMASGLAYLEDQGVDVMNHNISLWMPAIIKAGLYNDPLVNSILTNSRRPLSDGMINEYLGVDIRTLGSNGINTIPYTTNAGVNTYLVPMVAKDAMVQTFNRDVQTSITFVQQNDRYELLSVMTSGCNVVQSNGIALLTTTNQ